MYRIFAFLLMVVALSGCNPFAIAERTTAPGDINASGPVPIEALEECPVTRPPEPAFTPRTEIAPGQGHFFHGSDRLWTALPTSGVWNALPQTDKGFTQKVFWWSEDFDVSAEPKPSLAVTALLLDDTNAAPQTISSSAATTGSDASGSFIAVLRYDLSLLA